MVSGPGSFAPRFKARAIDLYRFSEGARAVAGAGIGTDTFRKWVDAYGLFAAPGLPVDRDATYDPVKDSKELWGREGIGLRGQAV